MAVPKQKRSRSSTRHRRAQWRAARPALVPVTVDGRTVCIPRRLVRAVHSGLVDPASLPTDRSSR